MGRVLDKNAVLNRLKEHLSIKGNTELARFLGVSPNTVTNWYNRGTFDIDSIYAKCEGLNLDWLLSGEGQITKNEVKPPKIKSNEQEYACLPRIDGANCVNDSHNSKCDSTTKKSRLDEIINYYSNGKPSQFAKLIGVAPSTISSWLSRDTLDYDLLFAKCENLSSDWLLTGIGSMIKGESSPPSSVIPPPPPPLPSDTTFLYNLYKEREAKIEAQAEEIGRLRQENKTLEEKIEGLLSDLSACYAADARSVGVAAAG